MPQLHNVTLVVSITWKIQFTLFGPKICFVAIFPVLSQSYFVIYALFSSCLPSFNNNKNMYTCGDIIIRKWHKYSLCKRTGLSNRKQMMPTDLFCSRYTSLAMSFTRSLYWNEPVSRQKIFKPNKYLNQRRVIQYIYFSRMVQFRYI